MGKAGRPWMNSRTPMKADEMFSQIKGLVEAFLKAQRIEGVIFTPANHAVLDEKYSVAVGVAGTTVGAFGLVREAIRAEWRMLEPVAVGELSLADLTGRAFSLPALKPIPAYPAIKRDVAIIVSEAVKHEDILKIIWKNAPKELTAVELFDIFRGEVIGQAMKSLAYSLVYRSYERTLTDEEANKHHEGIKAVLKRELKAEIREN
jgi:phenylalanyl-tRNA synthetase beta chain